MIALDLSPDGRMLLGVGLDAHAKQLMVLWDVSGVLAGCPAHIIARQTTDYNIKCARFSPFHPEQFMTCGKNSIRMYRLKVRTWHDI